jgi:hypothetical protein
MEGIINATEITTQKQRAEENWREDRTTKLNTKWNHLA